MPSIEIPRWDPEARRPSSEIEEIAAFLVPPAKILDAGCGAMGGNALFLARAGFAVDAFDRSEEAIQCLRRRAAEEEIEVRAWVDDVANFAHEDEYNLVICRGVLHFLAPMELERALVNLKASTAPSGLNALSVFDDGLPIPSDLQGLVRSTLSAAQLEQDYDGWSIRRCESYVLEDEHPGGIRHRHSILRFLAEKPQVAHS